MMLMVLFLKNHRDLIENIVVTHRAEIGYKIKLDIPSDDCMMWEQQHKTVLFYTAKSLKPKTRYIIAK